MSDRAIHQPTDVDVNTASVDRAVASDHGPNAATTATDTTSVDGVNAALKSNDVVDTTHNDKTLNNKLENDPTLPTGPTVQSPSIDNELAAAMPMDDMADQTVAPDLIAPIPPLAPGRFVRWLVRLIADIVREWQDDRLGDMAAAITFWAIISVPATVLALVSALSSLGAIIGAELATTVQDAIIGFVDNVFNGQPDVMNATESLFGSTNTGVAITGAIIALYSISRAFGGLIRALDMAYGVENGRPWWYTRIVALVLGLITFAVVAASAILLALLPELPLGAVSQWLSVPVIVSALVLWIATLYHVGPYRTAPWRYAFPGAILTAVGWLLATQGFAWYMRITARSNGVQSGIGAILLVLSLMHLLSSVLLVGAEVNELITERANVVTHTDTVGVRVRRFRRKIRNQIER